MRTKTDAPGSTENRSAERRQAGKADRQARLAEELRANLARRKAQARSRRTGGPDERPEGLAAAGSQGKSGNGDEPSREEGGT